MRLLDESRALLPEPSVEEGVDGLQRLLADKINNYATVEELRLLLVSGAKADGVVTLGLTPLHYAVHKNYFDAAKLLIVRGAQVDAVDEVGYSALHLCAEKGSFRLLKFLLEHLVNRNKCYAFEEQDQPFPIRAGADEPLRLALWQRHYDCAKLLLEMGADPNARYFDGPQITLVDPHELQAVKLLVEFGADVNVSSRKGVTPLMKACEGGLSTFATSQLLLGRGADVNALNLKSTYPMTALHYAVGSGHVETVKLLLEDVRVKDGDPSLRYPPVLHFAVMAGNLEMVQLLIDYGADMHSPNGIYGNALHLATCFRLDDPLNYKMVELLLQNGADVNRAVVNPHGVPIRPPAVEFFRRLYKYEVETGQGYGNWVRIASLLFAYGAKYELSPHNLDVQSMAIPTAKPWPRYADDLNFYLLHMHSGARDLAAVDPENAMYISKAQLDDLRSKPRSLLEQTRNFLRSRLRVRPELVHSLPISPLLRDFLLGRSGLPSV